MAADPSNIKVTANRMLAPSIKIKGIKPPSKAFSDHYSYKRYYEYHRPKYEKTRQYDYGNEEEYEYQYDNPE